VAPQRERTGMSSISRVSLANVALYISRVNTKVKFSTFT